MSLHNPSWQYIPAASHADPSAFQRRQRARMRAADLARKAVAAKEIEAAIERRAKVRKIGGAR